MALSLSGCLSDDNDDDLFLAVPTPPSSAVALAFGMENTSAIASNNNIPLPNDIYFFDADGVRQTNLVLMGCGATDRGVETEVENATKCSLEALDGWSTTAPFSLPLSGDLTKLDETSFDGGVRLFSPEGELGFGEDFTVQLTRFGHLQILPLKVMDQKTSYVLAITRQLTDSAGVSVTPASAYVKAKEEQTAVGQHILDVERKLTEEQGIAANDIVYSAQFTTQSIGTGLVEMASKAQSLSFEFDSATAKKSQVNGLPCKAGAEQNCIEKLSGTVELPNYLASAADVIAECDADSQHQREAKFWFELYGANTHHESFQYTKDSCPGLYQPVNFADTSTSTVEVSLVLPHQPDASTVSLNPVIAAHGITTLKEAGNGALLIFDNLVQPNIAGLAKSADGVGYAVVAVDHIYHGTRSLSLDGSTGFDCNGDSIADSGCFAGSDGAIEMKGVYDISVSSSLRGLPTFDRFAKADVKNFLKIDALLTSRSHIQKVIADLLNLKSAFANASDISGKVHFNADQTTIYGHSMGAISATSASGIAQLVGKPFSGSILANGGGGIAGVVLNSIWLGKDELPPSVKMLPEFRLYIAKALGIERGSEQATLAAVRQFAETQPEDFLAKVAEVEPAFLAESQYLVQAIVDTIDPLNYAQALQERPILTMNVVGTASDVDQQTELVDAKGQQFTAADQTVPVRIEVGESTRFTRCKPDAKGNVASVGPNNFCETGTEQAPYYALDNSDFPLAGSEPLDKALGLADVRQGSMRSSTRLTKGNHNIGVAKMSDQVAEGSRSNANITAAAKEIVNETIDFLTGEYGVVDKADESLLAPQF